MQVWMRASLAEEEEFDICSKYIKTERYLSALANNDTIIARYSVLPFYQDIEEELKLKNCELINSYKQHLYVADIENWYEDLKDLTPKTYFNLIDLPEGKYVLKGKTNSRKFEWNTRMFAKNKAAVQEVYKSLLDDSLISNQGVCIREYIPLVTYDIGINEMRFTNEWRCFFWGKELIAHGYYWSIYDGNRMMDLPKEAFDLLDGVKEIASQNINFYVVDIAQTEQGNWIVIELNDGQMSGLSTIDPDSFYEKLSKTL